MNNKSHVVTDHLGATITINGRKRICRNHPKGWRCHLTHAEVRALGVEPRPRRNYHLVGGQYVVEMVSGDYWPVPQLPVLMAGHDEPPEETWIDPLPKPVKEPRPRNYAGRAPRGLSLRYKPLVDAARAVAPLLPADHPLRVALDRLDATRRGERAEAEISAARAAMAAPAAAPNVD